MMEIIDFSNCRLSPRNLSYGGRAGEKRGIIYKDNYWILKFPKNTNNMHKVDISYTTSPLSEYIGSQIYKILGYDVHETILGICFDGKRNKVVCACKDFIKDDKNEELIPFTALRNDTSLAVMNRNDDSSRSASNLKEILFQLDNNEVLSKIPNAKSRFWETVVIDILINNKDRNEDNWGVIKFKKENKYVLAPIYDNGNSFYNKHDDNKINFILNDKNRLLSSALNGFTAYENDKDEKITFENILNINNKDLKDAIKIVKNKVKQHIKEIEHLINNIPNKFKNIEIISDIRKKYYLDTLTIRLNKLF